VNKKKQKNFIRLAPALPTPDAKFQKFFASFFPKKEDSSFLPLA
jgi:hypothetical protein